MVPRERLELSRFDGYWDKARVPKLDKVLLFPMPEAATRTAALLAGQVDWIEVPAPDAIPRLKQGNMAIVTNKYPHNWAYQPSMVEGSPWTDIRVRKAANLAIDRAGLKKLLGGLMEEGKGAVYPGHPWFGSPSFDIKYDPAAAKKLLAEAGYSATKKPKIKIAISTSGSGQMLPLPMNEYVQENLNAVGFDCTVRGDGMERAGDVRLPAGDRRGLDQGRHQRHQHQPRHGRSLLGLHAPLSQRVRAAARRQLGHGEGSPSSMR